MNGNVCQVCGAIEAPVAGFKGLELCSPHRELAQILLAALAQFGVDNAETYPQFLNTVPTNGMLDFLNRLGCQHRPQESTDCPHTLSTAELLAQTGFRGDFHNDCRVLLLLLFRYSKKNSNSRAWKTADQLSG